MHVVLCPGALSLGLPATLAVEVMAEGWRERCPHDLLTRLPLSDGAEGLIDAVRFSQGGELVATTVPDPFGRPLPATVLVLPPSGDAMRNGAVRSAGRRGRGTAVVEVGQVCGSHLFPPQERRTAVLNGTSEGVGRLLRAALETRPSRIVLGMGSGAVHDGGLGMLAGLGLRSPRLLTGAAGMGAIEEDDLSGLSDLRAELADCDLVVAAATAEPLVGLHGAGAALVRRADLEPDTAQEIDLAAAELSRLLAARMPPGPVLPMAGSGAERPADRARRATSGSAPFTGAGGGTALALAALGARLLDGAQTVAGLVGLAEHVDPDSLLLTATSELDGHALRSGVVATVAAAGLGRGAPTLVLARRAEASRREQAAAGVVASYALAGRPGPYQPVARDDGDETDRLRRLAGRVAASWSRS